AVGAVNGYIFNRLWTFAARDSMRARVLYVAVASVGAVSSSLLLLFFVRLAGVGRVWAYVVAIPAVTIGMFAGKRRWPFSSRSRAAGLTVPGVSTGPSGRLPAPTC